MEATELWRGLTSGRWSLVDSFERDGKRYYVAHENPMAKHPSLTPLSERERQVVAGAVTGHSDKLIAYAMGLSRSTVASHLASARRKLRVRSRVELLALGRRLAAAECEAM